MIYFNKLDSLRFLSFFVVFCAHLLSGFHFNIISENKYIIHFLQSIFSNGGLGVHVFFVLSGFLITYLLIQENNKNGRINILFFYVRRILRIWPLYYLILILGIFILPSIAGPFEFTGVAWKNLLFLNNFDILHNAQEIHTGVAWSVAIEEQFYLVWPICFAVLYNKKLLVPFTILIYILSCWYTISSPSTAYFHTFGNLNYLMVGCLGGIIYSTYRLRILPVIKSRSIFFINIALIIIFNNLTQYPVFILLPFNYLLVILYLADNDQSTKKNVFMRLGKYTYGMYLYHALFLIITKNIFLKFGLYYESSLPLLLYVGGISLIGTTFFSIISFHIFENQFLKLKDNFTLVNKKTISAKPKSSISD